MTFARSLTIATLMLFAGLGALLPSTSAAATTKCVTVYDFPDAGSKVCVFTEGPCVVGEYRTTFLGTEFYCLVPRP